MKVRFFGILTGFFLCTTAANGQKLRSETDSLSYALGILFGQQIQSAGFPAVNAEIFGQTVQKLINNEILEMTPEQAGNFVNRQYAKIQQLKYAKNLETGRAFLNSNRNAPGVVSLPSGLQYKVITAGTGEKPSATDKVTVHYHGTLINGAVFDSTIDRGQPIELSVNQVIKGWIEALQLMPVGSKWVLYIPSELAYGENPPPGRVIEPNSTLIFEIELLSINN